ncbi:MAG: glycine cleavage system protein H [Actinobacteria bacterium]|nr:glycine cleavage system protein H [Actinomycetota bacterium]
MAEKNRLVVLPCNGMDKEAGAISRELALLLSEKGADVICPVLYQSKPKRYQKELASGKLLVIDGCKTGCASKLAREHGLKIAKKATIKELLKEENLKSGKSPVIGKEKLGLLPAWAERLEELEDIAAEEGGTSFTAPVSFRRFAFDKFIFKVPEAGYFFNENDCWARVEGERARLGVSDYVQQSASDIIFFEPPEVGKELSMFDEAGSIESTKTALDIISPVSGTVTAVNGELVEAPELINSDPYVAGWAVEVELSDFESDRELLMDCAGYFDYLNEKVKKEYRKRYGGK